MTFDSEQRSQAMLVVSRKTGERVIIGQGVTITLIEVKGNRVRLGIDAPQEMPVWREELAGIKRGDRNPKARTGLESVTSAA
jgi:carbon storage regulator